ncbi:hypothetical protein E2C01_011255 [Portunus trituberculatus]|uniref:Uncharacterized protein n=1 Tax=Portunus trituberculatus TaxID=210409 RepID=A0A5B7DB84_PORTR|nr:hypothetical protein [Portunus trituberculatus]
MSITYTRVIFITSVFTVVTGQSWNILVQSTTLFSFSPLYGSLCVRHQLAASSDTDTLQATHWDTGRVEGSRMPSKSETRTNMLSTMGSSEGTCCPHPVQPLMFNNK